MKINSVFFEDGFICILTSEGDILRQSLSWYPHLLNASEKERLNYTTSGVGLHWRTLDTDVSFESFYYQPGQSVLMYMN